MTDAGPPGSGGSAPEENPLAVLADAGKPKAGATAPSSPARGATRGGGSRRGRGRGRGASTSAPGGAGSPPSATEPTASGPDRPTRPPVPPPTPAQEARASVLGFVILAVAVLLGTVLLWKGYDRSSGNLVSGTSPDSSAPERTTTIPTTTSLPPTTTSSTAPLKPPSQVTVRVVNASNPALTLGGDATSKLQKAGYKTQGAIDVTVQPTSAVLYTDGFEGEATEIANALGIASSQVQPMPSPAPTGANGVQVLVQLGQDFTPT